MDGFLKAIKETLWAIVKGTSQGEELLYVRLGHLRNIRVTVTLEPVKEKFVSE